ncbi:MAG: peptidase M12 [Rhodospirillaceae bacterium]|nr:MAG: peptidase M12 [Rhodospirillaceae bacterium]
MDHECLTCIPKRLPTEAANAAAETAIRINPLNRAPVERLSRVIPGLSNSKAYIAILTTKYWHTNGVKLTVGFLDNPQQDLRDRIILHMNAWSKTAKVQFTESNVDPQVRIARAGGQEGGYWSYLGTDVLSIDKNSPTMNLEGFTMNTPDSEFYRVVRHETGHTLGCPHEHMRAQLVAKIDPAKAIKYFEATQGWSEEEIRQQVLTPIEESSLRGTAYADQSSIMCYQIPGTITKDGKPIPGGMDIDKSDYDFIGLIYPK